jgi:hypothetical protein
VPLQRAANFGQRSVLTEQVPGPASCGRPGDDGDNAEFNIRP